MLLKGPMRGRQAPEVVAGLRNDTVNHVKRAERYGERGP